MRNSLLCCVVISLLCGCSNTSVVSNTPTPTLNIADQKPLQLAPVHVKVQVNNGEHEYVLTNKDLSNLAIDMEQLQKYSDVEHQKNEEAKHYYDNLNK